MPRLPHHQFRKPPKWTDLPPVPPILLVLVAGFIGWSLKGKASPIPVDLAQAKIIGIFIGIVSVGYLLARAGYMYMQKAATHTRRKWWGGIMCVGLLTLLGTLGLQYVRPELDLVSLTAWALLVVMIALFEGKNARTSMFIARMVNKAEDVLGIELDGYDNHPDVTSLRDTPEEDTEDSDLLEGFSTSETPIRRSAYDPSLTNSPRGASIGWNAGR